MKVLKNKKHVVSKILIIDDDQIHLRVTKLLFQELGLYNVHFATCGRDALKMANENFDLILIDITLPDMDGFELCAKIKGNQFKDSIFIAVTADNHISKNESINAGFNEHLLKPVKIEVLQQLIKKYS